jgi:DNA-binding XRE family transcriptional regulator
MRLRLLVKEIADQRGIKRSVLARKADITYETLTLLYRDPYRQIPLIVAVKLAKALNVDVADLFVVENDV